MKLALAALALAACVSKPDRPGEWKLVANADQPGALDAPRLVFDPALHAVVMFGGDLLDTPSDAMWKFDGSSWSSLCNPCGIGLENGGLAVAGDALVHFGGEDKNGSQHDDVFEYTGGSWLPLSTTGDNPGGMTFAQLVPYHDKLYAIGGYHSSPLMQVSSLTGTVWKQEPVGGDTMASVGMASTYDADHDRIVTLIDSAGNFPEDGVWSFDGTQWTKLCDPCTGLGKTGASIVHVPGYDLTLMIGGKVTTADRVAGSWLLDGAAFIPYDQPVIFPARMNVGVAYDPERERVVVYGGNSDDCPRGCAETWELTPE
jgi:hypothetical protein